MNDQLSSAPLTHLLEELHPFIQAYLKNNGVDMQALEQARRKRRQQGHGAKAHWSAEEVEAYGWYRKAGKAFSETDEGRVAETNKYVRALAEFNRATPSLKTVTDADFEATVLDNPGVVFIQFFACWCGPCHRSGPVIEAVATQLESVQFCKLDVDASPATTRRFAVKSFPTLMLFKRGGLREIYRAERSPEALTAWLKRHD